jgi:hypothetical protein
MEKTENAPDINVIERELHGVEDELQHFEEKQVNVTRALQMVVYPAMVAFVILSAYGFFLIQSLTTDMHLMNQSVSRNMENIANTMTVMNDHMTNLVQSTSKMTNNIVDMNASTQDMAGNIQQMNSSTQNMAVSTYNMQHDMWSMNKNISGPMKMFNKFNPFGNDKTTPYVVPPPAMTTPYYNNYYGMQQAQPAVGVAVQPVAPVAAPAAAVAVEPAAPFVPQTVPLNSSVPPAEKPATDTATSDGGRSAVEPLQESVLASATRG